MPDRNCAVFGCGSCRRTKGIGIWKLPLAVDEKHREWGEAWLGKLKKTRVIDSDFRDQIRNDRVYTCEKHFAPEDVEICKARFRRRSTHVPKLIDELSPAKERRLNQFGTAVLIRCGNVVKFDKVCRIIRHWSGN